MRDLDQSYIKSNETFFSVKISYNNQIHKTYCKSNITVKQLADDFVLKMKINTYGYKPMLKINGEEDLDDDTFVSDIEFIHDVVLCLIIRDNESSLDLTKIFHKMADNPIISYDDVENRLNRLRMRKEGFIRMKKNNSQSKTRYFILEEGILCYSKIETEKVYDFDKKPFLNISFKDTPSNLSDSKKTRGYIITLKRENNKIIHLAAITEDIMEYWRDMFLMSLNEKKHDVVKGRLYWFKNNKWKIYYCKFESNKLEISSQLKQEYFSLNKAKIETANDLTNMIKIISEKNDHISLFFYSKEDYISWTTQIRKYILSSMEENIVSFTLDESLFIHRIREFLIQETKLFERDKINLQKLVKNINHPQNSKKYLIISLEGGGCRGLITVAILERILKCFPDLLDRVQLFTGTSVGSLFACLMACGHHPTTGRKFLEVFSRCIFSKSMKARLGINEAKYCNKVLGTLVKEIVGDIKFKDLKRKLLVPTVILDNKKENYQERKAEPVVFHNLNDEFADLPVVDAVLGSCSAPFYFPAYKGYVDGGVFSNSPADLAVINVLANTNLRPEDIICLNIGTGQPNRFYDSEDGKYDWGLREWLPKITYLLWDSMMNKSDYTCKTLLKDNYLKITPFFENKKEPPIDDPSIFPTFIKMAKEFDITKTVQWLKEKLEINYETSLKKNKITSKHPTSQIISSEENPISYEDNTNFHSEILESAVSPMMSRRAKLKYALKHPINNLFRKTHTRNKSE